MDSAKNDISNSPSQPKDDPRSDQQRILDSLAAAGVKSEFICLSTFCGSYTLAGQRKVENNGFPCLEWGKLGNGGDRGRRYHRAALWLAVDLGSTTVVARLLDCNSGEILKEVSCFNKQIQWGTDILSRIFYCKDNKEKLEEVRRLRWNLFVNAWISWMQATPRSPW